MLLIDNEVFVVRGSSDCKIVVSGSSDEVSTHSSKSCLDSSTEQNRTDILINSCTVSQNELILVSVLDVIYDTILSLLRGQLDKRTILDNLELVLLTIDEVVGLSMCLFIAHS